MNKTASALTALKATGTDRFALLTGKKRIMTSGRFLVDPATGKKALPPASHFTISGKRFFLLGGRVFSIIAGKNGITIDDCKVK
jgi:hypothetical protein